jgi:acyl carrier protein
MKKSFWNIIEVMYLDHLAVTTSDFQKTLDDYLCMPDSRLIRGPAINYSQNVEYAFIELKQGLMIEILGLMDDSPISNHVSNKSGVYHLCFAVSDIEKSILIAANEGGKIITNPKEDDAFDGRKVAFLAHKNHGIFELVEAFPKSENNEFILNKDTENSETQLLSIFNNFFRIFDNKLVQDMTVDSTLDWDSASHILLMMEIEDMFNVSFSPDEIMSLSSYRAIQNSILSKLKGVD